MRNVANQITLGEVAGIGSRASGGLEQSGLSLVLAAGDNSALGWQTQGTCKQISPSWNWMTSMGQAEQVP